jgi:hypothetical protein
MVSTVVMAYSELGHILERHVGNKALDSKQGESTLNEIWAKVSTGFPYYGISPALIYLGVALVVVGLIAYSIAGKGRGSHAGREEVRRSYRRKLAQEMAKQDAEKIKAGEKPRRKYMQW